MMMHSSIHWPDSADPELWPLAVLHAVYIWNRVPSPETGLAPIDIFTKTRLPQSKLHELHVWGCPVYVLEKSLADGKKIPKWKPRSKRMVYMGVSPNHAANIPLVYNPTTGTITPQFQVVFDDWFTTVTSDNRQLPDLNQPEWQKMFGDSIYQYVPEENEDNTQPLSATDEVDHLVHAHRSGLVESSSKEQSSSNVKPSTPRGLLF